jgi:hypothetical protein
MKESKFFAEVMQEGAVVQGRKEVLQALEIRFGPELAAELQGPVGSLTDLDRLTELLRLAIPCRRPAEFRRTPASLAPAR